MLANDDECIQYAQYLLNQMINNMRMQLYIHNSRLMVLHELYDRSKNRNRKGCRISQLPLILETEENAI